VCGNQTGFQQAMGSMKKTVDTIVNTIVAIPVHPEGHCVCDLDCFLLTVVNC
jgi:hypothetical protein